MSADAQTQYHIVPVHDDLEQLGQRVQRDAGGEDRHDGEGDRVEAARLLVEAHLEVLRHRARL